MKNNELNVALYNYMHSIGANPKKELLLINSNKLVAYFSHYFACDLFTFSLEKVNEDELNLTQDVFLHKTSSHQYDFYELTNGKISSKNGIQSNAEIDNFISGDFFRIKRVAKEQNEKSFYQAIKSLTPKVGYYTIPLVFFGLLSPFYSNVFNSRLVYTNSNMTFLVITSVFLFFVAIEFYIKKQIKNKTVVETQKNITLLSDYFFDLFKLSKANNLSVKIRSVEQTSSFIWENVPLLSVDITFVILYGFCILLILNYFSVILFAYYILLCVAMMIVRFKSYTDLISSMKNSLEKASFLFSFERKKNELIFTNVNGANSVFIDSYSIDEMNKNSLDTQNHKWSELVKMNSFISMVVMYFCCLLSIKAEMLQVSAVIAVMIVNSRLSSSIVSVISKFYQLKVQRHNFFESCTAIFKDTRNIDGITLTTISSFEANDLSNEILQQRGVPSLNIEFSLGKTYVVTGSSGSGKTTLLKMLSGENIEYDGELFLNRVSTKNLSLQTFALNVAYHHANNDFIKANLKKNFEFYGISNLQQISKMLRFAAPKFELDHDKFELIEAEQLHFSNGEKQKLLLAMCLSKKPQIIILDEPTSFLSKTDAIRTIEWVKSNNKEAIIIFATHDPLLINMADEQISLQAVNENKVVVNFDMR